MLNHQNNYRIKLEFASFLRGLPEFIIHSTDLEGYVEVSIQPFHPYHFLAYFPPTSTSQQLIEKLFQELKKDYIEPNELMQLGRMFKEYWLLLKQIQNNRTYYAITPGMMTGVSIILHACLLFFPASKTLIYSSLIADFYSLSFWLFSIWSFNKKERDLHELESKLLEKINFLTFNDVLLENAVRDNGSTISMAPANGLSFFYVPVSHEGYDNVTIHGDHSQFRSERCYSI